MAMAEVTIKGAGIFGLSIAWACLKRGARVQVIDPNGPGAGASGGLVGALAPHVPENWNAKKAFQLESLLKAEGFWQEVEEVSGLSPGYGRTGRLQPLADARAVALAHERAEQAKTLWQGKASWRVIQACETNPTHPPSPTGQLIHDTLSARLHPAQACQALAAALTARGATISTEGAETGAVLHATGAAGLTALSNWFKRPVGMGIKGQAALLQFAQPDAPQVFVDGLHVIFHSDGTTAIGSTTEREFGHPTDTDDALNEIVAKARAALPALAEAPVLKRWAGLRPRAQSRAPLLGPWPGRTGHFIANGGFKIGFGMAPEVADTMARLMLENSDTIPEDFHSMTALCEKPAS